MGSQYILDKPALKEMMTSTPGTTDTWDVRSVSDKVATNRESNWTQGTSTTGQFHVPTNVAASDTTFIGKVRITWTSNSDYATDFRVYRDDVLIATVPRDANHYESTWSNICPSWNYEYYDFEAGDNIYHDYTVKAYNNVANVESGVSATSSGRAYPILPVASDGAYTNRGRISWFDQAPKADEVKIFRDGEEIGTVSANATVFYDYDAIPGKLHRYTVAPVRQGIVLGRSDNYGFRKANGKVEGVVQTITTAGINNADVSLRPVGTDIIRKSIDLTNLTASVNVGRVADLPVDAMTIEFWVKRPQRPMEIGFVYDNLEPSGSGLNIFFADDKLNLQTNSTLHVFSSNPFEKGYDTWTHVAVTVSNTERALFINGIRKETIPGTINWTNPNRDVIIGNTADGLNSLKGLIKDVRIWNIIRTDGEIASDTLRRLSGDEPGLLHYWPADNLCAQSHVLADIAVGGGCHGLMSNASLVADYPDVRPRAKTDPTGFYSIKGVYYAENMNFTVTPYKSSAALLHGFKPASLERVLELDNPTQQQANFIDTTTFSVEGYVQFPPYPGLNTGRIGVDSVEILVNGKYYGVVTRSGTNSGEGGKFQLAVEDAGWYEITPRYLDHSFDPPSIRLYVDDHITGTNALQFSDTTRRILHLRARAADRFDRQGDIKMGEVKVELTGYGTLQSNTQSKTVFTVNTNMEGNLTESEITAINDNLKLTGLGVRVPAMRYKLDLEYTYSGLPVHRATSKTRMVDLRDNMILRSINDSVSPPDTEWIGVEDTTQFFEYHSEPKISIDPFWDEPCSSNLDLRTLEEATTVTMTIKVTEEYIDIDNSTGPKLTRDLGNGKALIYNGIQDGFNGTPDTLEVYKGEVGRWLDATNRHDTNFVAGYPMVVGQPEIYPKGPQSLWYTKNFYLKIETEDYTVSSEDYNIAVLGERSLEATYATRSPEIPMLILRKPPGDNSFSTWERGTTRETSWNLKFEQGLTTKVWAGVKTGAGTFAPFSGAVGASAKIKGSLEIGLTAEENYSVTTTTTATENLSTQQGTESPILGDVFMGGSLNFIYSKTKKVQLASSGCELELSTGLAWGGDGFATTYMYTEDHIRNVIIPTWTNIKQIVLDSLLFVTDPTHRKQIQDYADVIDSKYIHAWHETLELNENLKEEAEFGMKLDMDSESPTYMQFIPDRRNISFSAGAPYSSSVATVEEKASEFNFSLYIDAEVAKEIEVEGGEFNGAEGGVSINLKLTFGGGFSNKKSVSTTTSFSLSDDDPGDFFSVDVKRDGTYGTPVFELVAGTSSCPWEEGTQPRDGTILTQGNPPEPGLSSNGYDRYDVLPDEPATFILTLTNTSETEETRTYKLAVNQLSNPDGAVITIGGVNVENGISYTIPATTPTYPGRPVTMTISRGPLAYKYYGIEITLTSDCDDQVTISKLFSVDFLSPCSNATIIEPANNFLVNQTNVNTLEFRVTDLEREKIAEYLIVEYRKIGTDKWKEAVSIPKNNLVDQKFEVYKFDWTIPPEVPDGQYDLRILIGCDSDVGAGKNYSNTVTGTINRSGLQIFGAPEPRDGVLNFGDQISAVFTNDVDCSELKPEYVELMYLDDSTRVPSDSIVVECNGNTIVVRPLVPLRQMQNRAMQVTVRDILDVNGNPLIAPVAWSFRVNQNSLVWETANASASAFRGSSCSITGTLRNVGGKMESFTLAPMREWLTPLGASGSLPPGGRQDVMFIISDKLNPGVYSDTVWALTADGDEPFYVEIKVLHTPPTWSVVPGQYDANMAITCQFVVDTILSNDVNDIVAAFMQGECRGVANMQFVPSLNAYRAFLTVAGNSSMYDSVRFRAWDASTGRFLVMQEIFPFNQSVSIGSMLNPTILHPSATQQIIPMQQGWNWFSLNTLAGNMSTNAVLASLQPAQGDVIKNHLNYSQFTNQWQGALSTLDVGKTYKLRLSNKGTLQVTGNMVPPNTPIAVNAGWNWIGYLPNRTAPISVALSSLAPWTDGDRLKGQDAFVEYSSTGGWQGSLGTMSVSEGYMLKLGSSGTLVYPDLGNLWQGKQTNSILGPHEHFTIPQWSVDPSRFELTMGVTAALSIKGVLSNDTRNLVGAFVDGECRGLAAPIEVDGTALYFVTLYSNGSQESLRFKAYLAECDSVVDVLETIPFMADAITGDPLHPYMLRVQSGTSAVEPLLPSDYVLEQNYPNPFNPGTSITYEIPERTHVLLRVVDIFGRVVAVLQDEIQPAGRYSVDFNAGRLPSGTYLYRFEAGGHSTTKSMMLLK